MPATRSPRRSSATRRTLAVGRAQYSMICAPDGGVIDDLIVYRLGPERFLVVANAGNAIVVSDELADAARAAGGPCSTTGRWRLARRHPGPTRRRGPRPADRRRSRRAALLRDRRGQRRGHPGARRAHRLHGRGRVRGVRRLGPGPEIWDALLEARGGRRRDRLRPGRARHAAPRGGDAALRQRARRDDEPVRGRPWSGRQAGEAGRLRRARGADARRRRRVRQAARRPRGRRAGGSRAMATRSMPASAGPASSPAARSRRPWASRSRWPTSRPAMREPGTILAVEVREQPVSAEVVPLPFYRRAR